ncbi:HpcH/HpaI aldolase/citrate lyase family protein [Desulfatirhabdium butyrativorans]|uniref:HpcH/HpaI aldolase/citrate lyase family protein n=1 Tax=Desulfatirhabdium butyrativorans TaxID=340467 RepID=UPI0003F75B90|nr:CoA ester lyase [Desulfatirhabdium butyrativorans]
MRLRRSTLSVPGHRESMHEKATRSHADVIMLDLEDSVPFESKVDARNLVIRSLLEKDWGNRTLTVRMNGIDTPFGYRDLLDVVEAAADRIDAIVVPKVDSPGDIHFVSRMIDGIARHLGVELAIGIEATIESARGMEQIAGIAAASPRMKTLVFGIADYSASLGARLVSISGHGENEETIYPGHRWHYAMCRIVNAARANGLLAIDAPYGHFRDNEGLARAARMSCSLGFDGKWAIHPDQIETIHAVFSPGKEDIERAGRVLAAFRMAKQQGRGAASLDGRMIDQATVRMAQQLWDQARELGMVESDPETL